MEKDIVIILDCGATNVRAVAVDAKGKILASASFPNNTVKQTGKNNYIVWDIDDIWGKLCAACKKVIAKTGSKNIRAVTVTTFGADGAPVDKNGRLTYPLISWQCQRTQQIMNEFAIEGTAARPKAGEPRPDNRSGRENIEEIYKISGYQLISFNTILRLMWLKKNAPASLKKAKYFLMTPGLLTHKLCGEFCIDSTIASTTMIMDIKKREWSDKLLKMAGVDRRFFPRWVEPGDVTGHVTAQAGARSGLPKGIPVIACGHDTQFALHGCGAKNNEAVLSTGTWEILLLRTRTCNLGKEGFMNGMTTECDAVKGYWNPQMLMMGSGVIEWVKNNFFKDVKNNIYDVMISGAKEVGPGSGGVIVIPSFKSDTGPFRRYNTKGAIRGINLATSRDQIFRACLEGLSYQVKAALEIMTGVTGYRPKAIRLAGGGAKNDLWAQIRADVCGLPIIVTEQKEATVLGAAMFALKGAGIYKTAEEASGNFKFSTKFFKPSKNKEIYKKLYEEFKKIVKR